MRQARTFGVEEAKLPVRVQGQGHLGGVRGAKRPSPASQRGMGGASYFIVGGSRGRSVYMPEPGR